MRPWDMKTGMQVIRANSHNNRMLNTVLDSVLERESYWNPVEKVVFLLST